MTLMQMIEQGMVWNLIVMGLLFILMVVLINAIGGKIAAQKDTGHEVPAAGKTADISAVIAAITAAVNEYKKKN
ncbi:MAG: sodium pump decarboxylase subunit gamma [Treponema sp.]|nr:sodium pump decarboxylase subunit gamma [Treponema sp.]